MTTLDQHVLAEEIFVSPAGVLGGTSGRPSSLLRRVLIGLDAVAAAGGWALGLGLTHGLSTPGSVAGGTPIIVALLTLTTIVLIGMQRLYLSRVCAIRSIEIGRLWRATGLAAAVALLLPRVLDIELSIPAAAAGSLTAFALLNVTRGCYRYWLQVGRRDGRFLRSVVVVGTNEEAAHLCKLVADHPELGFRIAGMVGDHGDVLALEHTVPFLGELDDIVGAVARTQANGVLIAASSIRPNQLNVVLREMLRRGIHVHLSSGVRGVAHHRLRAQPMAHEPIFYVEPLKLAAWQFAVKRTIDMVGTLLAGVVVLPVLAAAALAIKLSDRGPVLYRQIRVGRDGEHFTVLKLRTMRPNADQLYAELAETRAGREGPLIKLADDPRRTAVGRVLERLSIDELPQLWNVLRGEMSLVGPRPAQPSEVEKFDEELRTRHAVLPGITGLWQVEARDNPSFSAYRRFDLFYIENWSVSLDLAILVATVQRVLLRGAELMIGGKREMAAAIVLPPTPAVD